MGQAPALYLTCEDDEGQLHWRQHHICKALDVRMSDLMDACSPRALGRLDNPWTNAGPMPPTRFPSPISACPVSSGARA
jgi:hypothetical protein